jgi:CRISPR-associated protein Cas2
MIEERLYIITYDISDDRRWRRVFKLMKGYGRWLQLSVFQCRLSAQRRAELARRLEEVIHGRDDMCLFLISARRTRSIHGLRVWGRRSRQ